MKISEVIAKMKKVNETSAYVVWRCPLCRLVDFANTDKLEQHLKNEHGNDFEPEEKAINYQEFFNLDGKLIINAKNNEVYAKQSDFGWSCTFCSVLSDSARHALAHAYQHYKVAVSHFHKPESDGQSEQHLGAVTEVWWDEMTQSVRECKPEFPPFMRKDEMPPLGCLPRVIHEEHRMDAIIEAIERATTGYGQIRQEWIDEYNELAERRRKYERQNDLS